MCSPLASKTLATRERRGGCRFVIDDHRIVVARLEQRFRALLGQLLGLLLVGLAHRRRRAVQYCAALWCVRAIGRCGLRRVAAQCSLATG